jgi:hypothetical protein
VSDGSITSTSHRHIVAVAAVVVGGALVPLLAAWHYGTFGAARGDDWSYLRALFHWVDAGHLDFNNWVSMTLLGQLVLTAPLALIHHNDTTALQIATALLGVVGLLAVEWTVWTLTGRAARGAFVALVVAAGPMWGVLAVSYMTDVPAFAFAMLSMAVGVRALRDQTPSTAFVLASIVLGYVGFTIREYAGVPAAAIVIVAAMQAFRVGDRRAMFSTLAAGAIAALAVFAFLVVWRTVPNAKSLHPSFPTHHAVSTFFDKGSDLLRLAGLWLAPLLILRGPVRIVRDSWRANRIVTAIAATAVGAWLATTAIRLPRLAFAGNYFIPDGALGNGVSSGHRPLLVPMGWFDVLVVIGTLGAVLLVLYAVPGAQAAFRAARRRDPSALPGVPATRFIALSAVLYALVCAAAAITGLPLYDRYVLPFVAFLGVLVAMPRPPLPETAATASADTRRSTRQAWGAVIALALLGAVGTLYTVDSASFDGVRWKVSEAAVHAGWPADSVGGNFEWVNYYAAVPGTRLIRRSPCVSVIVGTAAVAPGAEVIARGTYHPPLHPSVPVIAVRTRVPCSRPAH